MNYEMIQRLAESFHFYQEEIESSIKTQKNNNH